MTSTIPQRPIRPSRARTAFLVSLSLSLRDNGSGHRACVAHRLYESSSMPHWRYARNNRNDK